MQIPDTPNSSVTNTCEMWRDFADAKFDIFAIIPHTDEGLYDGLVFGWVGVFWCFFSLWRWDALECLSIESTSEFDDDFAREFWSDTDGLCESLGFTTGYRLHDFILTEIEESEGSFWSETIHTEESSEEFFFFVVQKSYESRTCFGLMMIYPETYLIADIFETENFSRNTDRITDIIDEENYLTFFYVHDGADEESYHILIVSKLWYFQVSFFL